MNKISILSALLALTTGSLCAQVKSVKLDSTKAIVGGGNLYYSVVTTKSSDTFYTRVEVANTANFSTFFSTYWIQISNMGSTTTKNMWVIGYPLVDTLVLSYVRIAVLDDTSKTSTTMVSNNLSLVPKHRIVQPNIYSISVNTTTSGMTQQVGYTNGYADSSQIKCEVALDSNFVYKTNTQTWSVKVDGNLTYTVSGLKDNKQFFTRWTITNSAGSKVIKSSFITISNVAKIWLRKPADTVKTSTQSTINAVCDIKGRAISYGLSGTIWATISGITVSNIYTLTGVSEEWYILNIAGLMPSKTYTVWIHGKNTKGEDSFSLSITTPKYFNPTFSVTTDLVWGVSDGTAGAYASYNVPQGKTATITVGLFSESDSACTQALQDSTYNLGEGTGKLYKKFTGLAPGIYWIWFWGTCTDGQYVLTPAPLKLSIWFTGIESITTSTISLYPNPCTDFIHTTSFGPYSIHTVTGQIVQTGTGSDVDVRQLQNGIYIIKTQNGFARFQKQ